MQLHSDHLWTSFVFSVCVNCCSGRVGVGERKRTIKYWLYKRFGASEGILVRDGHTMLKPNPRCWHYFLSRCISWNLIMDILWGNTLPCPHMGRTSFNIKMDPYLIFTLKFTSQCKTTIQKKNKPTTTVSITPTWSDRNRKGMITDTCWLRCAQQLEKASGS